MEKCENFRREMTPTKQEIQFCMVEGQDRHCAGYEEFCPIPEDFTPVTEKIIVQDDHGYLVEEDPSDIIWEEDLEWKDNGL